MWVFTLSQEAATFSNQLIRTYKGLDPWIVMTGYLVPEHYIRSDDTSVAI